MADVGLRAHVLGRVRLVSDAGEVPLPSGRVGDLLLWFLLRPNETHPTHALIDVLWPGDTDASKARLQIVVSRLRRFLGQASEGEGGLRVLTDGDGYRLLADGRSLDRVAFEDLATGAVTGGHDRRAEALAWWEGEPYTGIPDSEERRRQCDHLVALRHRLEQLTDPPPVPASLRDGFVSTKFIRPRIEAIGILARRRLLDLAGAVGEAPMLAVTAPAGFGKSVFLSQWAEAQPVPVGWVTLDADDNDPVRFWSALLEGFARTDGIDLPPMPEAAPGSQLFVESLLDALAEVGTPIGLVLDDFHTIDDAELLAGLREHLTGSPAWLSVAVGTRDPVPVDDVARLVHVRAVTADDLRFSADEVAAVLRLTDHRDDTGEAASMARITDGWPVAVAYLSRTAATVTDADALAHQLDDYIVDEVLLTLPPQVERFLLDTASLHRLSAPLCDAVTGRDDSSERLDWLRSRELFVTAAHEDTGWYVYHPVVAAALGRRAEADPGVDVAEGQRRAARWCRAQALDEEALRYAMAGGEDDAVAALTGPVLYSAASRGELHLCERLLYALDPDVVVADRSSHDVAMLLVAGWLDRERSTAWTASRQRFGGGDDVMAMCVTAHRLLVEGQPRHAMAANDAAVAAAPSYFEAHRLPEGFAEVVVGTLQMGTLCCRILCGLVTATDGTMEAAATELSRDMPAMATWILGEWAYLAYVEGDHDLAARVLEQTETILVGMDRRSAELGATRALVTRALLDSDAATGPEAQGRIAAPLDGLVDRYQRLGWRIDLIPVLLALHVVRIRAGEIEAAAAHAVHADIELERCEDVPLLHLARERFDTGVGRRRAPAAAGPVAELSERQRTVLDQLEAGSTYTQIAAAMAITPGEVGSAVRAIYDVLGVGSRHEAVLARRVAGGATGGSGGRPPGSAP